MLANDTCPVRFELVEQLIKLVTVEDQTTTLFDRLEARAPDGIEGATANADICHGFRIGEPAVHERTPWWVEPTRYAPVGAIRSVRSAMNPWAFALLTLRCGLLRRLKKSFMEVP